jgi:tetratricopeptide (TPR) repeat protein
MAEASAGLAEKAAVSHGDEAAAQDREERRSDPVDADELYRLGRKACQHGRFAEGVEFLHRTVTLAPQHAKAHNLLGMALQRLGRGKEALTSFDRAIALAPELADAHGNRASVLVELGRAAEALASFDHALKLNPTSVEDWCNRGALLADLDRPAEAIKSFEQAIALEPAMPGIHFNRAKSLIELDRFEEALAGFDRAIALAPDFTEALSDRALLLARLGRLEAALDSIDRALALQLQSAPFLTNRAHVLRHLGRLQEARQSVDRALAIKPGSAEGLIERADILHRLGTPEPLPSLLPPLEIETSSEPDALRRMWDFIRSAWEDLGEKRAFHSVITYDRFLPDRLKESEQEFWESGQTEAASVVAKLETVSSMEMADAVLLEYGCGVGRVTVPLAKFVKRVVAYDISEPHLTLARKHATQFRQANVDAILMGGLDTEFERCDLFYSRIVLQHNPPPIIGHIVKKLIRALRPGGIGLFQVPTYGLGYRFIVNDYLEAPKILDMETHCFPQAELFSLIAGEGAHILEIREDNSVGRTDLYVSNVLLVTKAPSA